MQGRNFEPKLRIVVVVALLFLSLLVLVTPNIESKKPPCPMMIRPLGLEMVSSPLVLASPCPGNALTLKDSNLAVAIQSSPPFKWMPAIQVWQSVDPTNYEMTWFTEVGDVGQYSAVAIGNTDDEPQREIIAFTSEGKTTRVKGEKTTEYRVFFDVYEEGSTGFPSLESEYFVRSSKAYIIHAEIIDLEGDGQNEVVAIVHDRLVIYRYDADQEGYNIDFLSEPLLPVLGTSLREFGVGDLNGDGRLDIVTPAVGRGSMLVWERPTEQSSEWGYIESEQAQHDVYKGRVGDVDGDGYLEVVGSGYDSETGISYLSLWTYDSLSKSYKLIGTQPIDFGGPTGWGFEVGDVSGNGIEEVAMGTTSPGGKAMVLSFDGEHWNVTWSFDNLATTNSIDIGDADGDPATTELVFVGGKDGLYIEVFTWIGGEAVSSWTFSGDYRPAWDSHVG